MIQLIKQRPVSPPPTDPPEILVLGLPPVTTESELQLKVRNDKIFMTYRLLNSLRLEIEDTYCKCPMFESVHIIEESDLFNKVSSVEKLFFLQIVFDQSETDPINEINQICQRYAAYMDKIHIKLTPQKFSVFYHH